MSFEYHLRRVFFLLWFGMTFTPLADAYVNVPVAIMREEADPHAKIASSAFLSEPVFIISEKDGWIKIETVVDTAQGWVQKIVRVEGKKRKTVCLKTSDLLADPTSTIARVNRLAAHVYSEKDTIYGPVMTLPFECKLVVLNPGEDPSSRWLEVALPDGTQVFIQRGDISEHASLLTMEEMCEYSKRFLSLPYTWGGRTSFGYDCSGYVQMLYRQMGIYLPRNSNRQMHWGGFSPITIEQLKPGDLVFFGLSEDKIRHVGMYVGNNEFIHAGIGANKPYIRIARLTDPEYNGTGQYPYRAARTLRSISLCQARSIYSHRSE